MRFAKKVGNKKAFKNIVGAVLKEVPGTIGNLSKRVWINLIINMYFLFFVFN